MRRLAVVLAVLALAAACRPASVRLAFRPEAGSHSAYRVEVESVTVTSLDGSTPQRVADRFVLRAEHAVLTAGAASSQVRVRLAGEGLAPRTFVVSLDRDLAEIPRALRNLRPLLSRSVRLEAAVPVPPGRTDPRTITGFAYTHQITRDIFGLVRDDTDYTAPDRDWTPPALPRTLAERQPSRKSPGLP